MDTIPGFGDFGTTQEEISTGAFESNQDVRTVQADDTLGYPLITGGIDYLPADILHQHKVGICTAISQVQLRQKQMRRNYSADFQYLLQKRYFDLDWREGSSIINSMKVAKNFGFLPLELWTHTTEQDRFLPYAQYSAKLQAIPETEVQRLKALCIDKIAGYAEVDVTNPTSIAIAINKSEAGIICRYNIGETWWSPTWHTEDIDPLKAPVNPSSGHAIIGSKFDYSIIHLLTHPNTWGVLWNALGVGHVNYDNYKMTEAWTHLPETPIIKFQFTKTMKYGQTNNDVKELQRVLGVIQTGFFGNLTLKAVKNFQLAHNLTPDGVCGQLTIAKLNLVV